MDYLLPNIAEIVAQTRQQCVLEYEQKYGATMQEYEATIQEAKLKLQHSQAIIEQLNRDNSDVIKSLATKLHEVSLKLYLEIHMPRN